MNFIKKHLVSNIKIKVKDIKNQMGSIDNFIYFDEDIDIGYKQTINRINDWYPSKKEEIVNSGWHDIKGEFIIQIYHKLKYNRFYIYKSIDGKSYKIRKKC